MTVTTVDTQVSRPELELLLQTALRASERACTGSSVPRRVETRAVGVLACAAAAVLVHDVLLILGGLAG